MKLRPKIMTMADMRRLRGDSEPTTHLARYEVANDLGVKLVLDVPCRECGAGPNVQCFEGS